MRLKGKGRLLFSECVTGKGLLCFATLRCRGAGERLEAGKVMRPRGELNGKAGSIWADLLLSSRVRPTAGREQSSPCHKPLTWTPGRSNGVSGVARE